MSGTDTRLLVVGGAGSLYVNKEHTFCLSVSIRGKVKEIGSERLQRLLDKNPYMYEIYPTEQSLTALMVFCLYEGQGEWFNLSKKPIERFSFSFGGGRMEIDVYFITDDCIGCGKCLSVCPQSCIVLNGQKRLSSRKTVCIAEIA